MQTAQPRTFVGVAGQSSSVLSLQSLERLRQESHKLELAWATKLIQGLPGQLSEILCLPKILKRGLQIQLSGREPAQHAQSPGKRKEKPWVSYIGAKTRHGGTHLQFQEIKIGIQSNIHSKTLSPQPPPTKKKPKSVMIVHVCNSSIQGAEAG